MVHQVPVVFFNGGVPLAGRFYRSVAGLEQQQPVVLLTGSWLTVKEQMDDVYARALAELGYTAFTFDFSGFGQSGGAPRQAEIPERKIGDIAAAADFVSTMSFVKPGAIGHLSICASSQYALAAIARGAGIRSLVTVAAWCHDAATVAPLYGGADGVAARVEYAEKAVERFLASGQVDMVPAYQPGNPLAGMSFELDYYANPARGAIPPWRNEMAAMSWVYWLSFDGLRWAANVHIPTLMVHGDGCMLPDNVKRIHAALAGEKRLVWIEGFQVDFYDRPDLVGRAVAEAHQHFQRTL